ncbi:MAG: Co2+/Mg2+ efflux protein ApaG [Acidobacteria bacterium]|jgi:ApaG protein|nr:Co2+/Mg2+ efflux protein ApaG [Acidobacteriota bacterium]
MGRSTATTDGIRVEVTSRYVPERSAPPDDHYFFAYTVKVSNDGREAARLVNRHWIITDARGEVEQVHGPGVVGEQPRLEPGESFEYTGGCPLPTPRGSMRGTYEMWRDDGRRFLAEIAPFALEMPHTLN